MEETKRLPVRVSQEFNNDLNNIYNFGISNLWDQAG